MWADQAEQYERVLRSFSIGKLTESTIEFIKANKCVLTVRIPKNFCLRHNKYEVNCACKVSNLH